MSQLYFDCGSWISFDLQIHPCDNVIADLNYWFKPASTVGHWIGWWRQWWTGNDQNKRVCGIFKIFQNFSEETRKFKENCNRLFVFAVNISIWDPKHKPFRLTDSYSFYMVNFCYNTTLWNLELLPSSGKIMENTLLESLNEVHIYLHSFM